MNTQFANKIDLVRNSFPSLFSKDDVIRLIEDLSNETEKIMEDTKREPVIQRSIQEIFTQQSLERYAKKLVKLVAESLTENFNIDMIDDYELYMSGREVEIESISFSEHYIKDELESDIRDFLFDMAEDASEIQEVNQ